MIRSLRDVVESCVDLLAQMDSVNMALPPPARCYETSRMDGVRVLPDAVALRFLELNYVFGTHFVPGGLSAVGEAAADFVECGGATYLSLSLSGLLWNCTAFHVLRRAEPLYRQWYAHRDALSTRVHAFLSAVQADDANCYGRTVFQAPDRWSETYVGWQRLGTPSRAFVEALEEFPKQETYGELAKAAGRLARDLMPYVPLHDLMTDICRQVHHDSYPRIEGNLLVLSTPAASGGASLHTHPASDDLRHALPSENDLLILGAQAGTNALVHAGGGRLRGEHYILLVPREPFFDRVQERIDQSTEFQEHWRALIGSDCPVTESVWEWTIATKEIKEHVAAEILPPFVAQRVLGFHIDLVSGSDQRVAALRPVVAESLLTHDDSILETSGWCIERPPLASLLVDTGQDYMQFRSVFDAPPP